MTHIADSASSPPRIIQYGVRGPSRWRRLRMVGALLAIVISSAITIRWQWPRIFNQIRIQRLSYTCGGFTDRSDHVVFDSDPLPTDLSFHWEDSPSCWTELATRDNLSAIPVTNTLNTTIVFLHELRNRSGRRTMAVALCVNIVVDPAAASSYIFDINSLPPSWLDWKISFMSRGIHDPAFAPCVWDAPGRNARPYKGGFQRLRFFAGQPDPKDLSRFTIKFDVQEESSGKPQLQSGLIVGRYLDDGTIHLSVQEGCDVSAPAIRLPNIERSVPYPF